MRDQSHQLVEHIQPLQNCIVAYSGGVDSAVVAKAARLALGYENCLAITAVSPSVSRYELENALEVANQIGIRHRTIRTDEIKISDYVANDGQRCFHCKSELYSKLKLAFDEGDDQGAWIILNGTNQDDLQDHRPGLRAARDHDVRSPLAELEIRKSSVRKLARQWNLSVWDKPAAPCLASRIAYGEEVTVEKLKMIEEAEQVMRRFNFRQFRVRLLADRVASIEVELSDLDRLLEASTLGPISTSLHEIGFRKVQVDSEGFRSGNLNQMLATYEIGE